MLWVKRLKPFVFVACLLPLTWQLVQLFRGEIIDPVDEFTHAAGAWTLRFLLITLAITPLRILFNLGAIVSLRRMFGLFTFFYGCLHLAVFVTLDHYFDWPAIIEDITERRYVIAGFSALVIMLPLAVTSFNGAIKTLGAVRWQRLHRLVYVVAIAAMLHYFWLVKSDYTEPLIYAMILAVLFIVRIVHFMRRRAKRSIKRNKRAQRPGGHTGANTPQPSQQG